MPSSVDCIESESFYKCGSLESIDISNVQRIEDKAFMGCESLKEVNLLNKVYTGWDAFSQCNSLTTVKIPYGASICESFCDNRNLETVIMPSSAYISKGSFFDCPNLKSVYSFAENPDDLGPYGSYAFDITMQVDYATLYVPRGCADRYRSSEQWSGFKHIVEFDTSGIDSVANSGSSVEVSRYSVNGKLLAAPAKGLNIVKYSDGTVRKEMVK